ncbi:MAG: hypothetical protein RLY31_1300 [Bacteroidota bacterium]|jgi:hypothetical protein
MLPVEEGTCSQKEKSPPLAGGYIKNKNYEQTLTLFLLGFWVFYGFRQHLLHLKYIFCIYDCLVLANPVQQRVNNLSFFKFVKKYAKFRTYLRPCTDYQPLHGNRFPAHPKGAVTPGSGWRTSPPNPNVANHSIQMNGIGYGRSLHNAAPCDSVKMHPQQKIITWEIYLPDIENTLQTSSRPDWAGSVVDGSHRAYNFSLLFPLF